VTIGILVGNYEILHVFRWWDEEVETFVEITAILVGNYKILHVIRWWNAEVETFLETMY
jgi:hypothetical protein